MFYVCVLLFDEVWLFVFYLLFGLFGCGFLFILW